MDVNGIEGRGWGVTQFVKKCLAVLTSEYHFELCRRWAHASGC